MTQIALAFAFVLAMALQAPASGQAASVSSVEGRARTANRSIGAICDVKTLRETINDARLSSPSRDEIRHIAVLEQIYANPSACPLWSYNGLPTIQTLALIDQMLQAKSFGLDSTDYGMPSLHDAALNMASRGANGPRIEAFDIQMSRAVIRFVEHLNKGRTNPASLNFHLPSAGNELDLERVVVSLRSSRDVLETIRTIEPPFAGYHALKKALYKYRFMENDPAIPDWPRTRTLKSLDTSATVAALRMRLVAFEDLAADVSPVTDEYGTEMYAGAIVEAVKHFQMRHGLPQDGVLGKATQQALAVSISDRVQQMGLTLERWRWLPTRPAARYVVVNVPAFRLYAFENDATAAKPKVAMSVIVGRAQGRRTPLFSEVMQEVVFRPYWDVPINIARNELIPAIKRRPGYMDRESLEIVKGDDKHATIYAPTTENLARVAAGTLRMRQRPGPNNALGAVKFVFPNQFNVYMHDTPTRQLFALDRRDFSHGCIRLENPRALLEFVLSGQPGWDSTTMDAALHGEQARHVKLQQPVTVFVLYGTTVVGPSGELRIYPDVYGHDATLTRVLASQSHTSVTRRGSDSR